MMRNRRTLLVRQYRTGPDEEVKAILKEICTCPMKNVDDMIKRVLPRLNTLVSRIHLASEEDCLTMLLWCSLSLVAFTLIRVGDNSDNVEAEMLKRRVEQEHHRMVILLTIQYKDVDLLLRDYLGYISSSYLWNDEAISSHLLDLVPTQGVPIEDLVRNTCKTMMSEYRKGNKKEYKNLLNTTSYLMDKDWSSTSFGAQRCTEYLLQVYESLYGLDLSEDLTTIEAILKWIHYFVKRLRQPEHVTDVLDLLCTWLYLHASDVRQVIDVATLVFICTDTYGNLLEQLTLKHTFQDVVLCLINSDDLSTVSIGYDIVISVTDRIGNKRHFDRPKIYGEGELNQMKKPTRSFVEESLFYREDFVHMTDSIQKVVINSVNKFIDSGILARKVNTLVSVLALEGCDSAQGLTSVISLSLGVQDAMLRRSRRASSGEPDFTHRHMVFYHGAVASWFSLLCSVNSGELDLLRSYVRSVVAFRIDAAPYLLPSVGPVPMLPYYIYELDRSLYFDVDQVQAAIENSWVVLTNNRELLNTVKMPRSNILVEKYVDLQFLDSFDAYRPDDKNNEDPANLYLMDEVDTLFKDVENRYSEAFTEPFDRFQFGQQNTID